jgi:hypothetical protein
VVWKKKPYVKGLFNKRGPVIWHSHYNISETNDYVIPKEPSHSYVTSGMKNLPVQKLAITFLKFWFSLFNSLTVANK